MDRAPAWAQPRKAICAGLNPEGPGQMRSYGAKLPPSPTPALTRSQVWWPEVVSKNTEHPAEFKFQMNNGQFF